jgi:glycosyltransferase involved in cell wall biosynthesis
MNAALFAEPRNDKDFSEKLLSVILNDNLRKNLENNSLKRATFFQWEKSASLCIEALEKSICNRSGKNDNK